MLQESSREVLLSVGDLQTVQEENKSKIDEITDEVQNMNYPACLEQLQQVEQELETLQKVFNNKLTVLDQAQTRSPSKGKSDLQTEFMSAWVHSMEAKVQALEQTCSSDKEELVYAHESLTSEVRDLESLVKQQATIQKTITLARDDD